MMPAIEFERLWQGFKLHGFESWIPHAVNLASKTKKLRAQDILKHFVATWMNPGTGEQRQQSEEAVFGGLMQFAKKRGATFVGRDADDPYWSATA